MNVERLVSLLDAPNAAASWLDDIGIRDAAAGHQHLLAMANNGLTLDLLSELCEQLSLHLPNVSDADWALSCLSQFVEASRNPLSFGSLIEEDEQALPTLLRLFSTSGALSEILIREPASFDLVRLTEGQPIAKQSLIDEIGSEVANLHDRRDAMASLRHFKHRETLRIAYGDIIHEQPIELVSQQLTFLADAVCQAAMAFSYRELASELGTPRRRDGEPAGIVQVGLQRIGGQELDYSAKLKSLFIYCSDGRTDAVRPTDNAEFFDRLAGNFAKLLSSADDQGIAYLVDIEDTPAERLGRWCLPLAETLRYFDTRGRTWERQALIKARPIAGDLQLGLDFQDTIEPWVYRRYLSRADLSGIKALKRKLGKRTDSDEPAALDIDRGVTNTEFIVQFLQLINGGDQRDVRVGNTIRAIKQLELTGCVTPEESETLTSNYDWFRHVEHRLEIMHGPTAHRLPDDVQSLRVLAVRSGFGASSDAVTAFQRELEQRTKQNTEIINGLLEETFSDDSSEPLAEADLVLDPSPTAASIRETLGSYGFRDPEDAHCSLSALATEKIPFLSSRRCRHFLSRIAKQLLTSIRETPSPDATLANLCRVSESIGGKGVLWELFGWHPPSLDLYVRICSSSPYLTSILTRYPGMIDELIDSLMLAALPPLDELQTTLDDLCHKVDDIEPALHSFKNTQHLNIGVRELLDQVDTQEASASLSDVAEACLQRIAHDQYQRLVRKLGQPFEGETESPCELIILGMGKFGGREPNYHSDLDTVFLFSTEGQTRHPPTIRGRETTTNLHFFSELGQRIVKAISQHGSYGRLYESDSRIRPINANGPMAASLDAYRDHFLGNGRPSFAQLRALCRARPVYGSEAARNTIGTLVQEILCQADLVAPINKSARDERLRLQETAGPRNLKRGPGGMLDIEFIVHTLQLRYAREVPSVLCPNTFDALSRLVEHGILSAEDGNFLKDSYQFLRRVEARLRLLNTTARHDLPRERDELAKLNYLLRYEGAGRLEKECARFTRENRRMFERLLR